MNRRRFMDLAKGAAPLCLLGVPHVTLSAANTSRRVFIFSKHLQWLNYRDMSIVARDLGFDGIDLTVRPGGHVDPSNVEKQLPEAIKIIREEGLLIDTITTAITNSDEEAEKILKTAAEHGIRQLRLGWYDYDNEYNFEDNLSRITSKLEALNQLCSTYQVRADYQNHSGSGFGASIWDLREVYRQIEPEWLGIRFDIRHATVESAYSWPNDLMAIRSYIKSLDLKDFRWVTNGTETDVINVPLGEGLVDFHQYFQLLSQLEIGGDFSLHLEYPIGGAEHGNRALTVPKEVVTNALKSDLRFIRDQLD